MRLETILYSFFGNNLFVSPAIRWQMNFFKKNLPLDFQGKDMYDIGCGDGKTTLLLKKNLKAKNAFGYDIHPGLVERAKKRGIKAEVFDLEKEIPKGELAVMWGVLHHLKKQKEVLEKIKNNFDYFLMREPVKGFSIFSNIIELGKPFRKEEIKKILDEVFEDYKFYEYKGAVFAFWKRI